MRKIVLAIMVIACFLASEQGSANELKGIKEIVKVETARVTPDLDAAGLETYHGDKIALSRVKKRWLKKKTVAEILTRDQIELRSGEIIYPEEVRFALVAADKLERFKENVRSPHEKAPHTPN